MIKTLFRGKRVENEEWVEGYYWMNGLGNHFIRVIKDKNDNFVIEDYEVIPETIGQCSFIPDKNGTQIFDGDIVEFYFFDKNHRNVKTMLIEWTGTSFYMTEMFRNYRFLIKNSNLVSEIITEYKGDKRQGIYKSNQSYFVEVIGNIHDNPELLEVK